jgi:hypothetical protein
MTEKKTMIITTIIRRKILYYCAVYFEFWYLCEFAFSFTGGLSTPVAPFHPTLNHMNLPERERKTLKI